jgi:DNA helicase-2/ATP-dependent DNA helicase PcrA
MAISNVSSAEAPAQLPPSVAEVLAGLDTEQRAAATLPDGPAQIVAPAGSGKTTTMVARLAVLLSRGVAP